MFLWDNTEVIGYNSLHSSYFVEGNSYCNPITIYFKYNIAVFILIYTNRLVRITLFSGKETKKYHYVQLLFLSPNYFR